MVHRVRKCYGGGGKGETTRWNLPSKQVSAGSTARASGNGRLPVRLIDKDSSKVTNNVDDTKHETIAGKHGQIRTISVSRDRSASVLALLVESNVSHRIGENGFALSLVERGSLVEEGVDLVTGVKLDVDKEDHRDQHGKNDDGVNVTRQERSLKTSRGSVEDNTPGDQERSELVIHTGKSLDGSGTTKQKHGGHNNVGAKAKEEKGQMSSLSPTGIDNLGDGVGRRGNLLEVDGQDTEEEDLDGSTRGIPNKRKRKEESEG